MLSYSSSWRVFPHHLVFFHHRAEFFIFMPCFFIIMRCFHPVCSFLHYRIRISLLQRRVFFITVFFITKSDFSLPPRVFFITTMESSVLPHRVFSLPHRVFFITPPSFLRYYIEFSSLPHRVSLLSHRVSFVTTPGLCSLPHRVSHYPVGFRIISSLPLKTQLTEDGNVPFGKLRLVAPWPCVCACLCTRHV